MNIFLASTLLTACLDGSFLPPNNLDRKDDPLKRPRNVTEQEFSSIIDRAANYYKPVFAAHGKQIAVAKNWDDSTVNAYAQQTGDEWKISFFGGLVRREEITPDGFALIVCHEIGHHVGGFPFYGDYDWAASEGQSDYFATQACLQTLWKSDESINASFRSTVHPIAKQRCDESWAEAPGQNLCYRIAMAGYSAADLMAALGETTIDFSKPDLNEVATTQPEHPKAQCRLDTYLAGALCTTSFKEDLIPAKNHPQGQTSLGAETIADGFACSRALLQSRGSRPHCWYHPNRIPVLRSSEMSWMEVLGNNNGVREPGEIWSFLASIENTSEMAFSARPVRIHSPHEHLKLLTSQASVGELSAMSSQTTDQAFVVQIDDGIACSEQLPYSVDISTASGWESLSRKQIELGTLSESAVASEEAMEIPDNDQAGIQSSVRSEGKGRADSLDLHIEITHPYIGDLVVELVTPDGMSFMAWNKAGGNSDNINKTIRIPKAFASTDGQWTLKVRDVARADLGTLDRWSLSFRRQDCE